MGKEFSTEYLMNEISRCEDIEDLKNHIFPMIRSQQDQWKIKIQEILASSGMSQAAFSRSVGVSKVSIGKWCRGAIPRNRETFLKIGMAAGCSIGQMDVLLQRYGRYPGLYSKSLEDCICIYVINHFSGRKAVEKYDYILKSIKERILAGSTDDGSGTGPAGARSVYAEGSETEFFAARLSDIHDDYMLEQFISGNTGIFASAYSKFYAYVKMCIEENYTVYSKSLYDMAEGQGWSSSLRQCVSAINQKKWYPTRNKIISLGLHLSMDCDQINEMLGLAHMEPLCAKNIFESAIIFILEDARLNDMLDSGSEMYDPDELCRYARRILEDLDMEELNYFISELPEDDE